MGNTGPQDIPGSGSGTVSLVESTDGSVTVLDGAGPTVDLTGAGGGGAVASFDGRTGAVVPLTGDYAAYYDALGAASSVADGATAILAAAYKTLPGSVFLSEYCAGDGVTDDTANIDAALAAAVARGESLYCDVPPVSYLTQGGHRIEAASAVFAQAWVGGLGIGTPKMFTAKPSATGVAASFSPASFVITCSTTGLAVGMYVVDLTTPLNIPTYTVIDSIGVGTVTVTNPSATPLGTAAADSLQFEKTSMFADVRWFTKSASPGDSVPYTRVMNLTIDLSAMGAQQGITLCPYRAWVVGNWVYGPPLAGIVIADGNYQQNGIASVNQENRIYDNTVMYPATASTTIPLQYGIWVTAFGGSGNSDSFCANNVVQNCGGTAFRFDTAGDWKVLSNHPWSTFGQYEMYFTKPNGTLIAFNTLDPFGLVGTSGVTYYGMYFNSLDNITGSGNASGVTLIGNRTHTDESQGAGAGNFIYCYVSGINGSGTRSAFMNLIGNIWQQDAHGTGTSVAYSFNCGAAGTMNIRMAGETTQATSTYPNFGNPQTSGSGTVIMGQNVAGALAVGNAAIPSVAGTKATTPPSSSTVSLGALALGTALRNTLSYDVRLTACLNITANTSLVIKLGVGTGVSPTQETIITGSTEVGLVPVTFTVPAGYYALLSESGTGTVAIVGQYLEAA